MSSTLKSKDNDDDDSDMEDAWDETTRIKMAKLMKAGAHKMKGRDTLMRFVDAIEKTAGFPLVIREFSGMSKSNDHYAIMCSEENCPF